MQRIQTVKDESFPTNFIFYLNIPVILRPNNIDEKNHKKILKIINSFINFSISNQNVYIPTTNNKYNILHFLNGVTKIINILNKQIISRELHENNEIISEARKKIILQNRCNNINKLQRFYFEANNLIQHQHKKIETMEKNIRILNILSKIKVYILLLKNEINIKEIEFLMYKKFLFFKDHKKEFYPKISNMINFFNENKKTFQLILEKLEFFLKKRLN